MNPAWAGAPYGVAEGDGETLGGDVGRRAAQAMQPVIDVLSRMNDQRAEGEASKMRLDRARELETLMRAQKECSDFTLRSVIDRRISQIVAEMEAQPQPRVAVDEIIVEEKTATSSSDIERAVVCTNCGERHGSHWVNEIGKPLRCDVCGSATMAETEPTPEGHQEEPRA